MKDLVSKLLILIKNDLNSGYSINNIKKFINDYIKLIDDFTDENLENVFKKKICIKYNLNENEFNVISKNLTDKRDFLGFVKFYNLLKTQTKDININDCLSFFKNLNNKNLDTNKIVDIYKKTRILKNIQKSVFNINKKSTTLKL